MKDQVSEFIKRHKLKSVEDVINKLPQLMCHIGQEPEIFGTYRKRKNIPLEKANKKRIRQKIQQLKPEDYINYFLNKKGINPKLISPDDRVTAACKHMAEVSAMLIAKIKNTETYVLGKTLPSYATGRNSKVKHHHYFGALIENGKIRYFDSSVYKKVFNRKKCVWKTPKSLKFKHSDIDFKKFIVWDGFLQTSSNQKGPKIRKILIKKLNSPIILDTFSDKKLSNRHYYFRAISPKGTSSIYYLKNNKIRKKAFKVFK